MEEDQGKQDKRDEVLENEDKREVKVPWSEEEGEGEMRMRVKNITV